MGSPQYGLYELIKLDVDHIKRNLRLEALDMSNRDQILVVSDAVSLRTDANKQVALDTLATAGVELTSVEMCLFELMQGAEHPKFREVSRFVK